MELVNGVTNQVVKKRTLSGLSGKATLSITDPWKLDTSHNLITLYILTHSF